ncbi:heterokaryon incompatibility protein-domain-containing protein [Pyrenochaeta sp. MPI-SDFR-AT-0127]|nr:heterokaryon incompatibility protein-domain-containing protein [Pyrenochaeta sp. MPI-SDFR-AT-0127]
MSICTEFCEKIKALQVHHNLPSSDELSLQLPRVNDGGGWHLGTWREIQQRSQCGFCQLVVIAVSDNIIPGEYESIDPDQAIDVLLFPDEQSFRLSYPSRLGTRIAFVAGDGVTSRGPDTARIISRTGIDSSVIKEWLHICDTKHECRPQPVANEQKSEEKSQSSGGYWVFNEDSVSNFRVIDLKLGCVRHVPLDTRYVTLSYVWGQLPMFKLQKHNFEELTTAGSLDGIRKDLPQTINDAIAFVDAFGERYLWVDALCLVQDDVDDVRLGIEMMNSIYQGSCFTIVAASGSDANAGLSALSHLEGNSSRVQATREISPYVCMTVIHSIDWHLRKSVYNERGWTLQELVLPRRTVIFINGQAYFRCQEANWSEETWVDKHSHWLDSDDSNISRIPDPFDGFLPTSWAYQKLCEDFSHRSLRNDGDALRALAGVLRPLAGGMETDLIEGLPGYYLDHFLLFIASNGDLRRRDRFASYSWAGWDGNVMRARENFEWFEEDDDGSFHKIRRTENILKHLQHNRLLQWSAIDMTASSESLSRQAYDKPSLLFQLVKQYSSVFTAYERDQDPVKSQKYSADAWTSGSGSSGDMPNWDFDSDSDASGGNKTSRAFATKSQPLHTASIKAFDLANGKEEFDRVVARMTDKREKMWLSNWMAQRFFRIRQASSRASRFGPRPITRGGVDDGTHFRFRHPRNFHSTGGGKTKKDRRVERGELHIAKQMENETEPPYAALEIPQFPPFAVLHFVTISLHLALDPTPSETKAKTHGQRSNRGQLGNPFDRVPGIPLISKDDITVGSLHPDNIDSLGPPGSSIELILISYSQIPTLGSALLELENADAEKPWKLFWCLYIVWVGGIAERRGVAQVLQSALEVAVEPKPCVKGVLLG